MTSSVPTPGPGLTRLWHDFKQTFTPRPHSLQEVKLSLERAEREETDFIYLLKRHHDYLQESITVLTAADADASDKQWHLARFLHLLSMHSRAEQETLYLALTHAAAKEARIRGVAGLDEHALADGLGQELYELGFEEAWSEEIDAKARVLAALVAHHLQDEESQVFPVVERCLAETVLRDLLGEYLHKCAGYLEIEMRPGFHL